MRVVFDQADQIISYRVGQVWTKGAKRDRPVRKRPRRHAASAGAFEGGQVPGDVNKGRSEVDEGGAGGRRRDEHAIAPEAVRGAIEEGRGCKIATVEKPIPVAGVYYFLKHARLL